MRYGQALGVGVALLLAAQGLVGAEEQILKAGEEAPSFSLPALDGKREALSVYCGKVLSKPYVNNVKQIVIVSFWATYCKPCQKEIPELTEFMKKHESENIKLFCVSIDKEGASIVTPFVNEKGYKVPVLLDPYKATAKRYGVTSLPSLFVIDPEGVIRYSSTGFDENVSLVNKLDRAVASIGQGKAVEQDKKPASAGSSVPVKNDAVAGVAAVVPAKTKWNAVARVECGGNVNEVADELGVKADDIRTWYRDLKKAATILWGGE